MSRRARRILRGKMSGRVSGRVSVKESRMRVNYMVCKHATKRLYGQTSEGQRKGV